MPLGLYQNEAIDALSSMAPVMSPPPDTFDSFFSGAGKIAMRGFAEAGRAIHLTGAIGKRLEDYINGTGTEVQDKFFKQHEDVFQRAVDYWTPAPNEVGAAGEVVGSLISMLPMVIANPLAAVAKQSLTTSEDLTRKGVDPHVARAVGGLEGLGLGVGIWMPILGQNLWQRVVVGGAGFNALQGVVTRGAEQIILRDTPAREDYQAFDGKALTLDVLLGMAFGSIAHLSPAQRAQGAEMWERIQKWANEMPPSDVDAVTALRQAQHLNVDSTPGTPESHIDIDKHVTAMRKAIDDLVNGRPVDVEEVVGSARFLPDAQRAKFASDMNDYMTEQATRILKDEVLTAEQRARAEDVPGFLRSAEDLIALRERTGEPFAPDLQRAIDIATKPGFQRTATEKLYLDSFITGQRGFEAERARLQRLANQATEAPGQQPAATVSKGPASRADVSPPPPTEAGVPRPEGTATADPLAQEADAIVRDMPDLRIPVGTDDAGEPIMMSAKEYLDEARMDAQLAREDASLFEVAAACMLGAL